ncbi:LacI family DNA-binding transcriptional regulator [Lactobacillus sp. 0.1XD8-4]|uniref:LacI family DNA-binding transcriptional regulator n=1 Tax=uncultured Limosilactobacillus sp. TaxID=2837629 RepID=UPI00129D8498|nr:LacI family DNA-binding transcriptional regulator [uncultured Limosilactobacillus sp.]MRN06512.1 LacI family DNA-binding transcriptional regulator [Lactobacillus sp. 0.1XD8-4]
MSTIYDVAKEAGCAPSSVSKFITKHGYVSNKLGNKITAAMAKLDYHYNGLARNLSTKTNNRIGVIVPFLDHPYFQGLVNAIILEASKISKEVVILPTAYNANREQQYLQELEHNMVSSLIITSHSLPYAKIYPYQRFGKIVFCENSNHQQTRCVFNNRKEIFEKLFTTLKQKEITNFGFMFIRNPQDSKTTKETFEAFKKIFNHYPQPERIIYNCRTAEDGKNGYLKLKRTIPNLQIVLSESDISAAGAYQARGNSDTLIIGQGNQLVSKLLRFTSIDQHLDETGILALKLATEATSTMKEKVNFDIIWR